MIIFKYYLKKQLSLYLVLYFRILLSRSQSIEYVMSKVALNWVWYEHASGGRKLLRIRLLVEQITGKISNLLGILCSINAISNYLRCFLICVLVNFFISCTRRNICIFTETLSLSTCLYVCITFPPPLHLAKILPHTYL